MPWRVSTIMSERFEFIELLSSDQYSFTVLCKRYGISRQTGYKWLHRYHERGVEGLFDRSRIPCHQPSRTDIDLEEAIVSLRERYPAWGARKLRVLLQREALQDTVPSIATIARILRRRGLSRSRELDIAPRSVVRFEHSLPNALWQMDLKSGIQLSDRRKVFPVGLIDDHSRFLLGLWAVSDVRDDSVIACWIDAAQRYGIPDATLTDHGVQFRGEDDNTSAFRTLLWACDVRHTQGRIKHPQTQGKIERLWGTLKSEVLSRCDYRDLTSWQSKFDEWREEYNNVRPHQGLGDVPPCSRYCPSARAYSEPDRRARIGLPDSIYRMVGYKGMISLSGKMVTVGRGLEAWMVECRPLNNGFWHIFFRNRFIKELHLTM